MATVTKMPRFPVWGPWQMTCGLSMKSLGITGGTGGNTWNVQFVGAPTTLTVNGADSINVGDGNGVQDIFSSLTLTTGTPLIGKVRLTLNDQPDTIAHPSTKPVTITSGSVSGLAPAPINYSSEAAVLALSQLNVNAVCRRHRVRGLEHAGPGDGQAVGPGHEQLAHRARRRAVWQFNKSGTFFNQGIAFPNVYFSGIQCSTARRARTILSSPRASPRRLHRRRARARHPRLQQ